MEDTQEYIWTITVGGGYGSFQFIGTEKAAEETRREKAKWEQTVATKQKGEPYCFNPTGVDI